MPVILTTILSMISGLFGPITDWVRRKQEIIAAKQRAEDEYRLQVLKNMDTQIQQEGANSIVRLKATASWFKYITFVMWFYPFVMAQIRPVAAKEVFANLNIMPDWYTQSCVIIMFAIWGISVGAPAVQTMFSNLGGYLSNRKDAKYEHEQTMARINRQAVMNSFRKDLGGKLDQDTVNMIDRALNAGDDDPTNDVVTTAIEK